VSVETDLQLSPLANSHFSRGNHSVRAKDVDQPRGTSSQSQRWRLCWPLPDLTEHDFDCFAHHTCTSTHIAAVFQVEERLPLDRRSIPRKSQMCVLGGAGVRELPPLLPLLSHKVSFWSLLLGHKRSIAWPQCTGAYCRFHGTDPPWTVAWEGFRFRNPEFRLALRCI
jgi:hypothetical protein